MFQNPKKLLAAIVDPIDDSGSGMWQYDGDTIRAWFGGAIYQMWQAWKHHGQMPTSGGWLDQPLDLWVQIQAIDLAHDTWTYKNTKGADWSKLSPTQLEIIRRFDG